jgi:YfiH family protein
MILPGLITIPGFASEREGVRHFFGTRRQPTDPAVGDDRFRVVSVTQVHGTDVLVLDRPIALDEPISGEWDVLLTNQPGLFLAVRTADCVPLLLHDRQRSVVGALHAGWRGAVAGIVPKALAVMRETFGCDPKTVHVAIGPSAGACCYEVDEAVLTPLRTGFPEWRAVVRETGPARALLDLRELVRRQALGAGVRDEAIQTVGVCTICHDDLFYSYRREGRVNGTMVSGIGRLGRKQRKR